jgi:hypothetical protein
VNGWIVVVVIVVVVVVIVVNGWIVVVVVVVVVVLRSLYTSGVGCSPCREGACIHITLSLCFFECERKCSTTG